MCFSTSSERYVCRTFFKAGREKDLKLVVKTYNQWGRRLEGEPNTAARLAGWRWPSRCDFVCDERAIPPAFFVLYRLPWQELPSCEPICCNIINVHNHPSWATSRKEGMAWYSSIDPCILSAYNHCCLCACQLGKGGDICLCVHCTVHESKGIVHFKYTTV